MLNKLNFSFTGTSSRSEYWGTMIFTIVAIFLIAILWIVLCDIEPVGVIIGCLLLAGTVIASAWLNLAVAARRCRDAGINPWFSATMYIPYIGGIVFIVIGCLSSKSKTQNVVELV